MATSNLNQQKERRKEYHDRSMNTPLFTIGDKVLLHDEKSDGADQQNFHRCG
jgi:hypothetical protein